MKKFFIELLLNYNFLFFEVLNKLGKYAKSIVAYSPMTAMSVVTNGKEETEKHYLFQVLGPLLFCSLHSVSVVMDLGKNRWCWVSFLF